MIQASQVKKALEELKQIANDAGSVVTNPEEDEEEEIMEQARSYRRMSLVDLSKMVSKVSKWCQRSVNRPAVTAGCLWWTLVKWCQRSVNGVKGQ